MNIIQSFKEDIFSINANNFEKLALEAFFFQARHCEIYKEYLGLIRVDPLKITSIGQIPFLPINFFKGHIVTSVNREPSVVFESSGTTGQARSRHYVYDLDFYKRVSLTIFQKFYGNIEDYLILALLPSYLERGNASLVYMADFFIKSSKHPSSGFYLDNYEKLLSVLDRNRGEKIILLGVSFALLDMADLMDGPFNNLIIIETGGMKGRRKEMTRDEVHQYLGLKFGTKNIHSEYGMTELLSQGYALDGHWFQAPPWMKIYLRDINDPYSSPSEKRAGIIKVLDLANIEGCCFIETQDLGQMSENECFKVLGRVDNSDLRGCNLMVL